MSEFLHSPVLGAILMVFTLGGCGYGIWRSRREDLRRRDQRVRAIQGQALLVEIMLSQGEFGSQSERDAIHRLSDQLEQAILSNRAGTFDGDEFGNGKCTLFMYGPDADRLFRAVERQLRSSPLLRGGRVTRRYGPPDFREEVVTLEV